MPLRSGCQSSYGRVNLDDVLNTKAFDWEKASNAAGACRVVVSCACRVVSLCVCRV
jgi:hypothetical protein